MRFNLRHVFVAALATVSMGAAAQAADMYVKARPALTSPVPVYDWTGFFAGVHVGYPWGKVVNECPGGCPEHKIDSFFGGFQAGYNWQLPNRVVLGLWGTVPIISTTSDLITPAGNFPAQLRWAVAGGGRIGYAFDRVLPFVFAGGVVGGGRATSPFAGSEDQTHTGYTVGGGIEYAIDNRWSATARYAYVDMSKETYTIFPGERFGFVSNSVAFGLNYRFGGGAPLVAKY